jgi:energy-coupling factor transport system permease protein
MRSVLVFGEDWKTVLEAYWSKGVDVNQGSLIRRLRNYVAVAIPLVVITLNKVKDVDFAAESRGFKLGMKGRTYIDRFQWRPIDLFIIAGSLVAVAAIAVLAFQGRLNALTIAL